MKITFPTNDGSGLESHLADHFGRARTYTIIDLETDELKVIDNSGEHFGGRQSAPAILVDQGTNVLVCKGLGRKAIQRLGESGVDIYITDKLTVKQAYEAYKNNELRKATDNEACTESRHH
jgi:predicted Fe-Mo cluster-binding NifX family protein